MTCGYTVKRPDRLPYYRKEKATLFRISRYFSIFPAKEESRIVHILLAVNNPDLRLSIELLLNEEPGVEIVGSASESEGLLALVKSSQPDMVILSWDLPGSSGQKLLDAIDNQEFRPAVIVIGNSLHEKQQALDGGANAFIIKGDSPDLLAATFRRLRKEKGFLGK